MSPSTYRSFVGVTIAVVKVGICASEHEKRAGEMLRRKYSA